MKRLTTRRPRVLPPRAMVAETRGGHALDEVPLIVQPPAIVPMSEEQLQRAVATLVELLLWERERERDVQRAA